MELSLGIISRDEQKYFGNLGTLKIFKMKLFLPRQLVYRTIHVIDPFPSSHPNPCRRLAVLQDPKTPRRVSGTQHTKMFHSLLPDNPNKSSKHIKQY